MPPCSPTEIKVSTWRSEAGQISSKSAYQTPQEHSGQPFNQIKDQEWPIKEIIGARTKGNEREFEISWNESVFHKIYLNKSEDGKYFVLIEGVKWDIDSHEIVESTDEMLESCIIKWPATWKPERELLNARELINEFDRREAERAAAKTSDEPRDSIKPVSGSLPLPQLMQPEALEDWEHVPHLPNKVPAMRFKPQAMEKYHGSDFREAFARDLDVSHSFLKHWQPEMDQRGLIFRRRFVDSGREFDLGRGERRRAIFDYICGVEQHRQCEACESGLGPFPKCVVSRSSSRGACANCACGSSSKKCNFHHESKFEGTFADAILISRSCKRTLAVYA